MAKTAACVLSRGRGRLALLVKGEQALFELGLATLERVHGAVPALGEVSNEIAEMGEVFLVARLNAAVLELEVTGRAVRTGPRGARIVVSCR